MPEYALQPDDEGLPVRVTGALLKKGGSRRGRRRNWSLRYFVLDVAGGRLRYYEDAKLLQLAGSAMLLPETEVAVVTPARLKGRHAPVFEDEDPLYLELRGVSDDRGRPRPFAFALRALTKLEFTDWCRSLRFCVRELKKERVFNAGNNLVVASFDEREIGLSLNLSQDTSTKKRYVVCEATKGHVASQHLVPGDELVAILPRNSDLHDLPFYDDPSTTDFEHITTTIRHAPRPISLLFRRRPQPPHTRAASYGNDNGNGNGDGDGDASFLREEQQPEQQQPEQQQQQQQQQQRETNGRADGRREEQPVATEEEEEEKLDDEVDELDPLDSDCFYCFDDDAGDDYRELSIDDMRRKWQSGQLSGAAKVFVDDAWRPIDDLPKLRDRLRA